MRYAVILAGGTGTRLWPASRRKTPKQFLPLGSRAGESLLVATSRRLAAVPGGRIVVAAESQIEDVRAHLPDLPAEALLGEPVGRNTAAAMGLAAVHLLHRDADAVMGVIPSDHHVADEAGFGETIDRAFGVAERRDVIVTIGIVPTRPATGYGYVQLGDALEDGAFAVRRFVEKPDPDTARGYLASGDYLWNGGMFFVGANRLLAELRAHMPETHASLEEISSALREGGRDAAQAAAARVYPSLPAVSIDYGVMEHATDVVTLRGDFGWNDVGSWSSLAEYRDCDASGNVVAGEAILHNAHDNIVVGDADHVVAVVGVRDLVVVQSGNAVLVVPRRRAQQVRNVVDALEKRKLDQFL
jgi:mannose-1-phosphate guanylyltransferase